VFPKGIAREGWRLLRIHGAQPIGEWPLSLDGPCILGRPVPESDGFGLDLTPDLRVSRTHARLWFESGRFWIEDLDSRHGTRLSGTEIRGRGAVPLPPGVEIQVGESTWILASPEWHRLRGTALYVDLEVAPRVNCSLVHSGLPVVRRVIVRNPAREVSRASALLVVCRDLAASLSLAVDAIPPAASLEFPAPSLKFDMQLLEAQSETCYTRLEVSLDGRALQGARIPLEILPSNAWSSHPDDSLSLAAFVLPSHPLVQHLLYVACAHLPLDVGPEEVLRRLYEHFATDWHLAYRCEPVGSGPEDQRVRLPHQLLHDVERRVGEGTCLDLALLLAACLENAGIQPLIALVEAGDCQHALVGCWRRPHNGLEPLRFDSRRLLNGALWLDPTGCTRDPGLRTGYSDAAKLAESQLGSRKLVFGLDVAAARADGILPLPFSGEPRWSAAVAHAISEAETCSREMGTRLSTLMLFLGLLSVEGGVSRRVLGKCVTSVEETLSRLRSELRPSAEAGPASRGFRMALDLARSWAKAQSSPLVLEGHLLAALLSTPGESLRLALIGLNTSKEELLGILRAGIDGTPGPASLLESSLLVSRFEA
jgi:hypothetical protein